MRKKKKLNIYKITNFATVRVITAALLKNRVFWEVYCVIGRIVLTVLKDPLSPKLRELFVE
jgi:hypothetical protein